MMHRAWSSIVEVPYCFSRSYVKFQGHTALKIVEFDPNWAFPDCNSSLNSPMAMKCCTKPETAKERCLIVFQGHPSNFKVTRYKTSPILTQIGRFQTVGRSQLSNPSDLPCFAGLQIPGGGDNVESPSSGDPSLSLAVTRLQYHCHHTDDSSCSTRSDDRPGTISCAILHHHCTVYRPRQTGDVLSWLRIRAYCFLSGMLSGVVYTGVPL